MPDETIYSLAAHVQASNTFRSDSDACKILFGDFDATLVADAPANLDHFCVVTEYKYGSPDIVLNTATLSTLFHNLGVDSLVEVTPKDVTGKGIQKKPIGLASLSNGQAHLWRWCEKCSATERQEWGTTYWHLTHQSPGVYMCHIHHYPLDEITVPYWVRQQHFFLPESETCNTTKTNLSIRLPIADCLFRLTQLAIDITRDNSSQIHRQIFYNTIFNALQERGLTTKNGTIHHHKLSDEFIGRFHCLAGFPDYRDLLTNYNSKKIGISAPHLAPFKEVTLNLMLVDWLFGSWALFCAYYDWQAMLSETDESNTKARITDEPYKNSLDPEQDRAYYRDLHRNKCMIFLKQHPDATRTDFWRNNQHSARWLTRYDQVWFDEILRTCENVVAKRRQMKLSL